MASVVSDLENIKKSAVPKHRRPAYEELLGPLAPRPGKRGEIMDREYSVQGWDWSYPSDIRVIRREGIGVIRAVQN